MLNIKRVLVPTDFSPPSEAAFTYACALAVQFQGSLHVLHVLDSKAAQLLGLPLDRFQRPQQEAQERLRSLVSDAERFGLQATLATRVGSPHQEIVSYAEEHDVDLVVMGTHGRGPIAHMLLGSVAEKVVRTAGCPVLTVRSAVEIVESIERYASAWERMVPGYLRLSSAT